MSRQIGLLLIPVALSYGGYSPQTNTDSLFQLYYLEEENGLTNRINLAAYTGHVEDGYRDSGEHDTDLRWVSPGGSLSFDQSAAVPVDPSSAKSFELNLT